MSIDLSKIATVLSIFLSLWAAYKVLIELQEPRKALEQKVAILEKWHREDHDRIKKTAKLDVLIIESLSSLIEHQITGNGDAQLKEVQHKIDKFLREGYNE